ncbi:MAG: TIGR03032 family protein, partial [Solirubrobacterales bacterium]
GQAAAAPGAATGEARQAAAAQQQQQQRGRIGAQRNRVRSQNLQRFARPIFIVAPPRSGTSFLFETLARSPSLWTVGGESHQVIESLPGLQPANRGWDSNRLTPTDATPAAAERLRSVFLSQLRDRDGEQPAEDAAGLRMLEKTPKNSLRVPFLNAVFPNGLFVYLYRDPRESLSSMITAWESGRFVTYPQLPDWPGPPWSMVLTPEWRKLRGKELPEIVADQWAKATHALLHDLERIPGQRIHVVDYAQLVADPQAEIEKICKFAELEWDQELEDELPHSRHTVTPPEPEKWRRHEEVLEPVLPQVEELGRQARKWVDEPPSTRPQQGQRGQRGAAGAGASPLRSVNTSNFPEILGQLGSSLLITTYQTGRLICARKVGKGLNTHFRGFETPMGLAWKAPRLAIGTQSQVWEYQNLPQVCEKLEPAPEKHDACLIPRRIQYTGDIRIHDVAYAEDELWVVATRFSCLATLDGEHSFVPRWRPSFISKLAAEDRCHLNGLAVIDDKVRYVTALGETDTPGGWRENKASGGVLIDVESSETVVKGLSMPHSPRWYRDRLWLLESGEGSLATIDLDTGEVETVVELPGFTRGLTFAGPLAFVGLSEVREATTFGGLPLTGRLEERQCGVWVVNIETSQVIGFLRFEDIVQEIFDVQILPGMKFPEIAEHGSDAVNLSYVLPERDLAEAAA